MVIIQKAIAAILPYNLYRAIHSAAPTSGGCPTAQSPFSIPRTDEVKIAIPQPIQPIILPLSELNLIADVPFFPSVI